MELQSCPLRKTSLTPLFFMLFSQVALADIHLKLDTFDSKGLVEQRSLSLKKDKVRIDLKVPEEEATYVLFDARSRLYWLVDPASESAERKTEAEIWDKQQSSAGIVTVKLTGAQTTVAGIACRWVELNLRDLLKYQLCIADAQALGISDTELGYIYDAITYDDDIRLDFTALGIAGLPIASKSDMPEMEQFKLVSLDKSKPDLSYVVPEHYFMANQEDSN
jgi:hypothetical protein